MRKSTRGHRRASLEHISEHRTGVQIAQHYEEKQLGFFWEFSILHSQHGSLNRAGMADLMLSAPNGSGTVSSGATDRPGQTQHSRNPPGLLQHCPGLMSSAPVPCRRLIKMRPSHLCCQLDLDILVAEGPGETRTVRHFWLTCDTVSLHQETQMTGDWNRYLLPTSIWESPWEMNIRSKLAVSRKRHVTCLFKTMESSHCVAALLSFISPLWQPGE